MSIVRPLFIIKVKPTWLYSGTSLVEHDITYMSRKVICSYRCAYLSPRTTAGFRGALLGKLPNSASPLVFMFCK